MLLFSLSSQNWENGTSISRSKCRSTAFRQPFATNMGSNLLSFNHALAALASGLVHCCILRTWGNRAPLCSGIGLQIQTWWCPTNKGWIDSCKTCARVNGNLARSVAESWIFQLTFSKVSAALWKSDLNRRCKVAPQYLQLDAI